MLLAPKRFTVGSDTLLVYVSSPSTPGRPASQRDGTALHGQLQGWQGSSLRRHQPTTHSHREGIFVKIRKIASHPQLLYAGAGIDLRVYPVITPVDPAFFFAAHRPTQ
jgi:hypothetical protein